MGAGHGLVALDDNVLGRSDLTQAGGQMLGILGTVGVGDPDDILAGVFNILLVHLGEPLDGSASAALLFDADYLALLVADEQRLYLQNRACQRNGV